jgi:hypothetical protein
MFSNSSQKSIFQSVVPIIVLPVLLMLSACGGSEEVDEPAQEPVVDPGNPPAQNNAPVLTINNSRTNANSNETVEFSASATDEEDGDLSANIEWQSDLDGAIGQGASIASQLSVGSHTITASVVDSGDASDEKTISITISQESVNTAPELSINTTSGTVVHGLQSLTLTASASDAEDGDLAANIEWQSNIDGSLGQGASVESALSFGEHTITAIVADSENATTEQSISIIINQIPVANAGEDQTAAEETQVNLSATTEDADGEIASVIWQQVSGMTVELENNTSNATSFQAPSLEVADGNQELVFEITVTDNLGATHTDEVIVIVEPVAQSFGIATISWTAPTENTDGSELTDLAGFKVYYGVAPDALDESITVEDAATYALVIDNLAAGNTYYFAVSAFNANSSESELSDISSKHIAL